MCVCVCVCGCWYLYVFKIVCVCAHALCFRMCIFAYSCVLLCHMLLYKPVCTHPCTYTVKLISMLCVMSAAFLWTTRALDVHLWIPAGQRVEQHCPQLEERGGRQPGWGRPTAGRFDAKFSVTVSYENECQER